MDCFGALQPRSYPYTTSTSIGHHQTSRAPPIQLAESSPSSPFMKVFQINGLATEIWEIAYGGKYPTTLGRQEVATHLRICKDLFQQLAPLVWRRLGQWEVPFLLCLLIPGWYEQEGRGIVSNNFLLILQVYREQIMHGHELQKFLWYASHVHSMVVAPITVCPGTFDFISLLFEKAHPQQPHDHLFPRLRYIQWTEPSLPSNDILRLLSPATVYVYIVAYDFGNNNALSRAFVSRVANVCKYATLHARNLQYFGVEAIADVANRPFIINVPNPGNNQIVDDLDGVTSELPMLDQLQLASWRGSAALFDSMAMICCSSTVARLRKLDLQSLAVPSTGPTSQNPQFVAAIQPLLALSSLEHVVLNFPHHPFHMSDLDLRHMVQGWTHLQVLGIGFEILPLPGAYNPPQLESLGYVTKRCLRLHSLTLPSWSISEPIHRLRIQSPGDHPLKELRAQQVDWNDDAASVGVIAQCLHQAFPRLMDRTDIIEFVRFSPASR
ncbi:hypothetical protein C8Q80DRAFT_1124113 [Daedaleopsis nitida]|nr:hypothetical protein C8Q80DRAFT_1124113 [Daedaleopsis nitida]